MTPARRQYDAYHTPAWQVDALVDHVPAIAGTIWEPCVGDGSLLARLMERVPAITGMLTADIDPGCSPMVVEDMTQESSWQLLVEAFDGPPDWVITNPPFGEAFPILREAIRYARVGVAFLSRLSFVEPTHLRGEYLRAHPHDQRIVLERWSYTGNGRTDASTTEWLIYVKDWRILTPPFGVSAYGYRPAR